MGITDEEIARINALYKKAQAEGLTDDEKAEQQILRRKYIDSVTGNLRSSIAGYKYQPKVDVRSHKKDD